MRKKKIVAMLLAGGQGARLGALTTHMAKPAVPYGGKYRIIDFPLSNCTNSDIDTVGVLTQYEPLALNAYIGNGAAWDLDRNNGGVYVLPPYVKEGEKGDWYAGTANAIFQNIAFIEQFDPDYVLILSGDHIYRMDYAKMLDFHCAHNADATIAIKPVPMNEASRFGIMNTDENERIYEFEEKPKEPKSNKASMGIYIFNWDKLRKYLVEDSVRDSAHDFGKNIIPNMLNDGLQLFAYPFNGYWKDVGTVTSLWEANMDLLEYPPELDLHHKDWRIYSKNPVMPPHYIGAEAEVNRALISEGAEIYGSVEHSVVFFGAYVGAGAVVKDAVIMPGAKIGAGAVVRKCIVGENTVIGENALVGDPLKDGDAPVDNRLTGEIALIGNDMQIPDGLRIPEGMLCTPETLSALMDERR